MNMSSPLVASGLKPLCHWPAALAMTLCAVAPLAAHAADALRIVRDPITGEMRGPNAAEVAAFEKAEAQLRAKNGTAAPKPRTEIRYPDGTVETKLNDDDVLYSVVRANEDGTLSQQCLPAKQAKAYVLSAKPVNALSSASKSASKTKAATSAKHGHSHD